jgi:Nif-specific regulatory protein
LGSPGRLDEVLAQVLDLLASFVDLRRGVIALIDSFGEVRPVVGLGGFSARPGGARLPERAIGRVVTTRAPVIVENVDGDADFAAWPAGPSGARQAVIAAPIFDRPSFVGKLSRGDRRRRALPRHDRQYDRSDPASL